MRVHEKMADNRVRFSQRLNEMGDELNTLVKEVEKNRKQVRYSFNAICYITDNNLLKKTKDLAIRFERALQESESITDKYKNRLDLTSEELERVLLQKEGESLKDNVVHQSRSGGAGSKRVIGKAVAKGGLLLKGKNPGNVLVMLFLG